MANIISEGKSIQVLKQQNFKDEITVCLIGNPNCGKSTVFNLLTGTHQHVANYPGVTVEHKEGLCRYKDQQLTIVDLPGTYSLTAHSPDEQVANDFLLGKNPDVVVNVIDSSNLERNLYLSLQILELGLPVVLAFNMGDLARKRGIEFDIAGLEELLGTQIVVMEANKGIGKKALLKAIACRESDGIDQKPLKVNYGPEIEMELALLEEYLTDCPTKDIRANPRWLAVKLLEGNSVVQSQLDNPTIETVVKASRQRLDTIFDNGLDAVIAQKRYEFISDICRQAVRCSLEAKASVSDRLDSILLHRMLGLPIFLALMYLVFYVTFSLGEVPMGWIEDAIGWLGSFVGSLWPQESQSLLRGLLVDGIIGGVGGVIVFLPNIVLLFLAIAMLEDSGYMARAAFLMDRIMNKIGLHGKSFIPMLIGFGCSVPAIMATRTLENRRDRLTTMLVLPLMSCGARLPIYSLIIPAFFPQTWRAPMLWLIYFIGIVLAIICAKLLRTTLFKGQSQTFIMELPPYRLPTIQTVAMHIFERAGLYLKKAGTIILGLSIVLWALSQWPKPPAEHINQFEAAKVVIQNRADLDEKAKQRQYEDIDHASAEAVLQSSLMGKLGRTIEPVLRPCGFDWKISTAIIGSFAAKEVYVAQMGIINSLGRADECSESLRSHLRATYTPLQGFCIMLYCLTSAPCIATIAVTRRESGLWKWAFFQLAGLTVMAWVLTTVVYQIGRLTM